MTILLTHPGGCRDSVFLEGAKVVILRDETKVRLIIGEGKIDSLFAGLLHAPIKGPQGFERGTCLNPRRYRI
ncbi:hypothetical protein E2562_007060 [Oryza meyeriana var. granulata]|uniref:Uncharacterized protein n=1 Tax=Oryza meyeriana var. granulata TaxID=110450 RepID=A0A6G1F4S1_9ORYZ|nr:hypothetical protein E2562_007060 [Oryza meyeriana var. granulata]